MLIATNTSSRNQKMAERHRSLRLQLWPGISESILWRRTKKVGFTTIPRTFPLMFQIMDGLSKGKPVSSTYFELWCRSNDECFSILSKQEEIAFCSGFSGQRSYQTWLGRMKILGGLGFFIPKSGPYGEFSHVLLPNPYLVIRRHSREQTPGFDNDAFNTLAIRASEIGADDISVPEEEDVARQERNDKMKTKALSQPVRLPAGRRREK